MRVYTSKLLSSMAVAVVVLLVLCTAAVNVSPSVRAQNTGAAVNGWTGGVIPGTNSSGQKYNPSVAYTSTGAPRVAYYDEFNSDLRYLAKVGSTWSSEKVDSKGDVGRYCDLALDANNRPWISYYDSTNGHLKCAWLNASNVWHNVTVDKASFVGMFTAIAIGPDGQPRISYYDAENWHLKYASRSASGTWTNSTVDSNGTVGWLTSIAINPKTGQPAISYYDATNHSLKYAWRNGTTGKWVNETADASAGDVGSYSSLAFTSAGAPCISYQDSTHGDLKYAAKVGSKWTYKTFPTAALDGEYTSLVLSNNDLPRISSIDQTNNRILFTWENASKVWHTQGVTPAGTSGLYYTSIAIYRPTGKTGICYTNWGGNVTVNLMEKTYPWN